VLEDDNLVASVDVRTEHLLTRPDDDTHVEAFLRVQLRALWRTWGNWFV
jgi:hypothetical protein